MLPLKKKIQLVLIGLVCSVLTAIAINALFAFLPEDWDLTSRIDREFYNLFFTPRLKAHPRLIVIDSDDAFAERSRGEYAGLVRRLHEAGARCIALDIRFLGERRNDPAGDSVLVETVAAIPAVVLAISFTNTEQPTRYANSLLEGKALPESFRKIFIPKIVAERGVDMPYDNLLAVAPAVGHINSKDDDDKIARRYPPLVLFQQRCYAALPIAVTRVLLDSTRHKPAGCSDTTAAGESDNLESFAASFDWFSVPLDGDGQILVNFVPLEDFKPNPYPWSTCLQLLDRDPELFCGAVVLVVNAAGEEDVDTSIGFYPRWAFQASAINQILHNEHIETSVLLYPVFLSAIVCGLGMVAFLFVAPRLDKKWRKTRVVFAGGSLLFVLLIIWFLRHQQVWFGVAVPFLVYNLSMLIVRSRFYQFSKLPKHEELTLSVAENGSIQVESTLGGQDQTEVELDSSLFDNVKFQEQLQRIRVLQAEPKEIKSAGETLFKAIFSGKGEEAMNMLREDLNKIRSGNKSGLRLQQRKLRLRLRLDKDELALLPWELMRYARLPVERLVLSPEVSLIRYLPLREASDPKPFRAPLKILVAVSSPLVLGQLDVASEKNRIQKALRPLVWSGDVRLRFCEHATLDRLSLGVEQQGADILHFIGHSRFDNQTGESYLELEAEDGERMSVNADDLVTALKDFLPRLVVLNSCQSAAASANDAFTGLAQKLVKAGVPAVVAMQFKILDTTAILFSEIFYSTLITNFSIESAVAEARLRIMRIERQDPLGWATPVLFLRSANGGIFDMN